MRIAHLTSVHPRYDARIFRKECRSLATAGHQVTLIVADGKGDEYRDGVAFVDVGRPVGRMRRMLDTVNKVYRAALQLEADIFHLHDPELLRIALKLKRLRGGNAKVVYDAHEDYVKQISINRHLPAPVRFVAARALGALERYVVRRLDGLVVVTDKQADRFRRRAKRCAVVQNFADLSSFPLRVLDFDRARILYAGVLSDDRGLQEMLKLAGRMGAKGDVSLAGPLSGSPPQRELGNASYLGVLDEAHLLAAYARSNIGLILYRPVGQYGEATSIKVYEYMAAGMPIIVPDHGDWPTLIRRARCGFAVDVNDVDQQLKAVESLLSNHERAREMGRNGREYALRHASWDMASRALAAMYDEI